MQSIATRWGLPEARMPMPKSPLKLHLLGRERLGGRNRAQDVRVLRSGRCKDLCHMWAGRNSERRSVVVKVRRRSRPTGPSLAGAFRAE